MSLGLAGFTGSYGTAPNCIFGYCLVLLVVLFQLGLHSAKKPSVFGVYWAYVFPIAALATNAIKMADTQQSKASEIIAWILIVFATFTIVGVFIRMCYH